MIETRLDNRQIEILIQEEKKLLKKCNIYFLPFKIVCCIWIFAAFLNLFIPLIPEMEFFVRCAMLFFGTPISLLIGFGFPYYLTFSTRKRIKNYKSGNFYSYINTVVDKCYDEREQDYYLLLNNIQQPFFVSKKMFDAIEVGRPVIVVRNHRQNCCYNYEFFGMR